MIFDLFIIEYEFQGKKKKYFPDFAITYNDKICIEEVKGWVQKNDQEKFDIKCKAAFDFCFKNSLVYVISFMKRK